MFIKISRALLMSVAFACAVTYAGQRTELVKTVKTDTVTQLDTLKFLKYDTLKVTVTYRDTSILIKRDTVISSSKPVKIQKQK